MQARGIDAACMQHTGSIDMVHRGRGVGPSCGLGALMQCAGVLTRHAWVGLTRHAGVLTQHAGTGPGGVDAGQGCSQGEGRWQHEKKKPL